MTSTDLDLGRYALGWSDDVEYVFKPKKGLNESSTGDVVVEGRAGVDARFRLKSLRTFERKPDAAVVRRQHARHRLRRHLLLHQAHERAGRRVG